MPDLEFIDENNVDDQKCDDDQKVHLPAYPSTIFELSEDELKHFYHLKYTGNMNNLELRLRWKMFFVWQYWSQVRNDQKLADILMKKHDRESDVFQVCNTIINMLDNLARILTITPLVEEIVPNAKEFTEDASECDELKKCEQMC
jgi:hypothetical protein